MPKFHLWNNGRSIFNIGLISRMFMMKSPVEGEKEQCWIRIDGTNYNVSLEEYVRIVKMIEETKDGNRVASTKS